MRRINHNLELLVPRLRSIGYQFVHELPHTTPSAASIWDSVIQQAKEQLGDRVDPAFFNRFDQMKGGIVERFSSMQQHMQKSLEQWKADHPTPPRPPTDPVWRRPDAELRRQIEEDSTNYGPIPLAFAAWFELVGEVDLCGIHPLLACYESRAQPERQGPVSDPLVMTWMPVEDYVDYEDESEDEVPLLELAPDSLHKSNISGGGALAIRLPNAAIDAPLISDDQWTGVYLIPYLRRCFAYGGFPALHDNPKEHEAARETLAMLTADFLDF
jgi:hypothetical protein